MQQSRRHLAGASRVSLDRVALGHDARAAVAALAIHRDEARSRNLVRGCRNFVRFVPASARTAMKLLWMSSSELGGVVFGQPGVDAGLEFGVAAFATLDACEPLEGDVEVLGHDAHRQADCCA